MLRRTRTAIGLAVTALVVALSAPAVQADTSAPAARTSDRTGADDAVYVIQPRSDGTTYTAIYEPAPGVTADELRSSLRRQGVRGVQDANSSLDVGITGCAPVVGTASAWCGHKWDYGPFNDPQVYFLDHSGDSWPVTDARVDWYQAPGIDAYYRWHTAGCPGGGRHCVHVYSGSYGTDWYGVTEASSSGGYFVDGSVTVKLNDQVTPNTYAARRSVACHEMGHALGLDHNGSTNSCLSVPEFPQHPSSDDFAVLNQLYPKPGT
ncbi:matrixin family metalloprotease [Streptomyces sp. uw30]|uniref:matrixin family metalloprotease n=1 Tax=Streptomyces sp. uw30 TaxID=1828179 RepID=UPI001651812F|nr:matrixin family metalloprotease [Streptomyces sp. uw30]